MADCSVRILDRAQITDDIKTMVLTQLQKTCKDNIMSKYGKKALKNADFLFVSTREQSLELRKTVKKTDVCGFACIRAVSGSEWSIDLLCSHLRQGTRILEKVEDFAQQHGVTKISLDALSGVEKYYENQGFSYVHKDGGGGKSTQKMIKVF